MERPYLISGPASRPASLEWIMVVQWTNLVLSVSRQADCQAEIPSPCSGPISSRQWLGKLTGKLRLGHGQAEGIVPSELDQQAKLGNWSLKESVERTVALWSVDIDMQALRMQLHEQPASGFSPSGGLQALRR